MFLSVIQDGLKGEDMVLQNEFYKITITIDKMFNVESTDNIHYDIILNPQNFRHHDRYKVFCIEIDDGIEVTKIALVGDSYSYDSHCAILEDNVLLVLQNRVINEIDIQKGCLLQYKEFECFGCNYGIYKTNGGYIIYGEIEIIMLDWDFCKKWSFMGSDIFVSHASKKSFEICEDRIKLYDYEDNYYEIDFSGKLLN